MGITNISQKYQLVIPKDIREKFNLKSGQKITVVLNGRVFISE